MLVSWWDREINVCRVTTNLLKHANLMDPHSELEAGSVMDKILIQVNSSPQNGIPAL